MPDPARPAAGVALVAALVLAVAGCAPSSGLARQYRSGDGKGYVSGDGTVLEVAPADRGAPRALAGQASDGSRIDLRALRGRVVVLNVWYAGCGPCIKEAPALEAAYRRLAPMRVAFVGINSRGEPAEMIKAFASRRGVTYPSISDTDGQVLLALRGDASPQAVPTTLVLDAQGRVAARVVGATTTATVVTLVQAVLAEGEPGHRAAGAGRP